MEPCLKGIIDLNNIAQQIDLPYFYLPQRQMTILIDSGASDSIISPKIAKLYPNNIFKEPFEVTACKQTYKENQNLKIPLLQELGITKEFKLRILNWHNDFDALIGTKDLKKLNALINYENKTLTLKNIQIPFSLAYNKPLTRPVINVNNNMLTIPVNYEKGLAILPSFSIQGNIIPDSLIEVTDGFCKIPNPAPKVNINFHQRMKVIPRDHFELLNPPTNNSHQFNPEKQLRLDHLTPLEKSKILPLCHNFKDIMYHEECDLTFTSQTKHVIRTTDEKPIYVKSFRHPPGMNMEIQAQIQKLLDNKIIRPSISPYSAPVWIVPKKPDASGKRKFRMVIDYRRLNDVTCEEKYPLPRIEEILDNLGKCTYFTTLDLAQGFHQIEMDPTSIEKTAFSVNHGHFEYLRMPFGLKNAPSTFQRMMDEILRDYLYKFCFVYMDDVVIFSKSLSEHIDHIRVIFKKLRDVNLKIQPDKSEFLCKEVAFLGHIITPEGIKPNPLKIEAIQRYPMPKNQKEIKAFLGLVGYYRRFIQNFSKVTFPITKCLRKGSENNIGNQEYKNAFTKCKELITNSPILQYPDFCKPFKLTTDASNIAIGSVLSQNEHPIAYYSRTLNTAERNYSTIEKELLSIIDSTKHFRPYLYGQKFTIETDHNPLVWISKIKEPNSRLIRWKLKLEEFNFEIKYKKGKENFVADALSRIEINTHETNQDAQSNAPNVDDTIANLADFDLADFVLNERYNDVTEKDSTPQPQGEPNLLANREDQDNASDATVHSNNDPQGKGLPISELPLNYALNRLVISYGEDFSHTFTRPFKKNHHFVKIPKEDQQSHISRIFKEIIRPDLSFTIFIPDPELKVEFQRMTAANLNPSARLILSSIYLTDVTNPEQQKEIISNYHQNNHNGIVETYNHIKQKYYWPKLRDSITHLINNCEICLQSKYERHPYKIAYEGPLLSEKPFKTLHLDLFQFSNCQFLTIIDSFSKYAQAYFVPDKNAVTILSKLRHYFAHHNTPQRIVSDQGREFQNNLFKEFCQLFGIEIHYTTPGNSSSNSPVERLHSTLLEKLRVLKTQNPDETPQNLMTSAILIYNQSIHSTTGHSPFSILYGPYLNEPNLNNDLTLFEQYNEKRKKELLPFYDHVYKSAYQKQLHNTQRQNKNTEEPPDIKKNQTIYKKTNFRNKISPQFIRTKVTETDKNKITGISKKKPVTTHVRKIKRLRKNPISFQPPDPNPEDPGEPLPSTSGL